MKNTFLYLSTCDTCKRIMVDLVLPEDTVLQDVKTTPITEDQLDFLYNHTQSYEALFNKRARKYRSLGLKEVLVNDEDYKSHILSEYTFLKRPVAVIDGEVYIGNSKKVVQSLQERYGR